MSNKPNRRRRTLPRYGTDLDRRIKAEMRIERRGTVDARSWGVLRRRLGWPMAIVGGLLFVASYVGSLAGVTVLPFDDHHLIGQSGGVLLGITGVIWATSRAASPDRNAPGRSGPTGSRTGSAHQGRTTRPS